MAISYKIKRDFGSQMRSGILKASSQKTILCAVVNFVTLSREVKFILGYIMIPVFSQFLSVKKFR